MINAVEIPQTPSPTEPNLGWGEDGFVNLVYVKDAKERAAQEVIPPASLIGRHGDCEIRLPSVEVSRFHCVIYFKAGNLHLRDLESLNGTQLNGEFVHQAMLADQDLIQIGPFTLRVETNLGCDHREPQTASERVRDEEPFLVSFCAS